MSDFEIFSGFDTADQMDQQSFERFKERIIKNAAQMASDQKQEQRQKEKEDKLARILLKFLNKNQKMHLILLISRALEENIPSFFILSIVLLGNPEIQEEAGIKLQLEEGEMRRLTEIEAQNKKLLAHNDGPNKQILNITSFSAQKDLLPLKIKIAIDLWGRNIFETGSVNPHKVLKTSFIQSPNNPSHHKEILTKLASTVLEDFLLENQIKSDHENCREFGKFMIEGILHKLKTQITDQKQLADN